MLEAANTEYKLATVEINLSLTLISSDFIALPLAPRRLLKYLNLKPEKNG